MSADTVVSIVWDVFKKYAVVPIERRFRYLISSKRFAKDLREEVLNLEKKAERVHRTAEVARNNLRTFYSEFTEWQANVEKTVKEAGEVLDEFEKASKTCCYGTLPDPCYRYQFSMKAEAKIKVVQELTQGCNRFRKLDDICSIDPAPGNLAAPTPARREGKDVDQSTTVTASVFSTSMSIKLREAGVFDSRASIIQDIMDALANNSNSVVGVYGMGGVGKSTLLDEIKRLLIEEKSFDWVAKADVSKNPDIKKIQEEIADALGLTDIKDKNSNNGRADLLRERLKEEEKNKKKVLIILDNLWEGLDLNKVGIPCGHDNKIRGCKLLLTSRERDVLQRKMGCDVSLPLGGLEKEEAKSLFQSIVGSKVHDDEFKPLVEVALDRCKGVPFLIVAIAKRFKDANLIEWEDTLKKIEKFKDKEINNLIDQMLQWSFDKLEEEVKLLLRLCVVYGISKPSLENLVRYGFGLGIVREVSSMKEARDRLDCHIRALQASSLLLDSEDVAIFKLHDLVSEFVSSVASKDHPLLVLKDKVNLALELQKGKPNSYRAICFPYVDMEELPENLDYSKLQMFLLFTNNKSLHVPDSLFNSMRKLKILNLTGIRFPLSFQFLENLHTLCLDDCSLYNVANLGELKGLQILSFVNSDILRLPKEIGLLMELRLLDLNNCSQLKVIEPGVLGSLTKLEELYIEDSFDEWNALDLTPATNASLIELNNMKNLCTLHVSIPDPSVIPKDLNFEKLTKYKIRIGTLRLWPSECKGMRSLELRLDSLSSVLGKGCVQSILDKTDNLLLDNLDGSEQNICLLSRNGFTKLKHLRIEYSLSIQYILQSPSHTDFKMLESLLLKNLINLEKICHNNISSKSFSALKILRIESCDKMETLFPLSVVKGLPQLEEIEVVRCNLISAIVKADDCDNVELQNLRVLKLCNLPNIKNFISAESAPSSGISDGQSSNQIAFFNGIQVSIPSLESLTMDGLPNLKEIWSDESALELSNLRSFQVLRCESLMKVISSRSLSKLHKLHTLTIKDCVSAQEIFFLDGPSGGGSVETISHLTILELYNMRSLRRIWNKNPCGIVRFPYLKKLNVESCDNLGFLFYPSMIESLVQLKDLTVSSCNKMEAIIMEEEELGMEMSETLTFSMLTNIYLALLESLTCFLHRKCKIYFFYFHHKYLCVDRFILAIQIMILSSANDKSMTGSQGAQSRDLIQSRSIVLFNGEVAFPRLESIDIYGLGNVRFMFFPSMVTSVPLLKKLNVWGCEKIEAIIMEEEMSGMETLKALAFPMLSELRLSYMKRLTCFSRGKCSHEAHDEDHIISCSIALFNREVAFPSLETLVVDRMDNIGFIWDNQAAADSFHKLKSLYVYECNKLVNLIPSCMLRRLLSLESLTAENCGSLEVVFKLQPLNPPDRHLVASFPLKKLNLSDLPKLKCVWDKELHCQVEFDHLRSINVSICESLTTLFPAVVANVLNELEELKIEECGIVELIEKEEGPVPRFGFSKLTSLKLKHVRELKCIYNGAHALHWPTLKTLEVHGCNKVEIFASQFDNGMTLDKQPLFLIEKGPFPKLEELKLDLFKRMEIWNEHFHDEEFFRKLRVLKLHHHSKESPISTYSFVESLTNLEELVVSESYIEEPSSNDEATEDTSHELKVIFPFSGYIQHLQTLDVSEYDGLSNMFTPTIAGNMVALTKLRISNCRILTEVISDEEGEEERCVVAFKQLKYMELNGLTELRCFSSGIFTLMFPLLEDVIMNGCPSMKFFSKGPIEAPKLERLQVDFKILDGPKKYRYFWKGDLNITVQNMFEEMATVAGARIMRLFDFPELVGKWNGELNPIKSYWQLESLVVDKCPSFINILPSKLMLVLEKLESLEVHTCESLEEIFDFEGLEAMESIGVLPQLRQLSLANLPKLGQLWNRNLQGMMRFNSLSSLTLYKCDNLRHAFVPSMARCLPDLWRIIIKECSQIEGVIGEEERQGSVMEKITFPRLFEIRLKCLPNLTSFLSGKNHTLDSPKMNFLIIAHCPKMRSLTRWTSMDLDHGAPSLFTPQVQFPQLQELALSHMDSLSKICTDDSQETLTFDNLQEVDIQNCKNLKNLFSHRVATSLNQLQKLRVESCEIEEIVNRGEDTTHSNTAQALFPKLTSLVLHDMSRLKSFCPNLPTLNWAFLEELRVTHCGKVNMLSFATFMNELNQKNDQRDLSDQETHSSFEKGFLNLEKLLLVDKDIQMIQDGKFPNDVFGKQKSLTLACFHEENAVFPSKFLVERFQNLQSLEIFCSPFQDIFPDEGLVDEGRCPVLENLEKLKLSKLTNLKSVWGEDYLVSKILQSIKSFEIQDCPALTTLFPVVASFQNLTRLVVKNSSGLVHLVTVSAVINLVHLTNMTIEGCKRMKEVVKNDGNGEGKLISLEKLRTLTLQNLPSLECFSSTTSCGFMFPSLGYMEVEECPKMKIFFKGTLRMPKLQKAKLFGCKWNKAWKSDLNTAIQQLSA